MTKHCKIYMAHFNLTIADYIPCEIPDCGRVSVDIHHVVPRSKFGKKRKDEQDSVTNLVALCRHHHEQAHDNKITKEQLKEIITNR